MKNNNFKYDVDQECDFTFDEKGNTFLALRKVYWGDSTEPKLDLRKWYVNGEGEETCGKGFAFLTEEGPNELTKVLLDNGYGHTDEIIQSIKNREDFMTSLVSVLNSDELDKANVDKSDIQEEYYDPTESLLED